MDLHDYADVAMNYDYYLHKITNQLMFENFESFHLSLAEKYGADGILDIACGTGALTIPLAQASYDVTALDLSAPMIEVTRDKLQKEGLQANLLVVNMADFTLNRKFSLAIIARSGFMHLLNPKEQRQTLLNIREHLTDGGVLTFNHFQPHPAVQAEQMKSKDDEYIQRAEYINHEGNRERIYNSFSYDYITQVMRGKWKFETIDNDGNIADVRVRPIAMRHTYRQEMEYLFELCGFEIMNVYNNYCLDDAKDNFVWVVKKKPAGIRLIIPTIEHKQAALDYRQEHIDRGETHIHGSGGLLYAEDYESWLDKVTRAKTMVQEGWVKGTTYFAYMDDEIVGTIQVRHSLNDFLFHTGGHIGYGVRPTQRRKGYASQMLVLALAECRNLGIDKALVTCNKGNLGSARTIIKNGGVYENEVFEDNGNIVQRFWITV